MCAAGVGVAAAFDCGEAVFVGGHGFGVFSLVGLLVVFLVLCIAVLVLCFGCIRFSCFEVVLLSFLRVFWCRGVGESWVVWGGRLGVGVLVVGLVVLGVGRVFGLGGLVGVWWGLSVVGGLVGVVGLLLLGVFVVGSVLGLGVGDPAPVGGCGVGDDEVTVRLVYGGEEGVTVPLPVGWLEVS